MGDIGFIMICDICKKEITNGCPFCHFISDIIGLDIDFYTHMGDCQDEFAGRYINKQTEDKPVKSRFDILDI